MKPPILFIVTLISVFCIDQCSSSRILLVFPSSSPSHLIIAKALAKELANRGHEMTVVSAFPLSKPMKNYRDIKVDFPDKLTSTFAFRLFIYFKFNEFSLAGIVAKFIEDSGNKGAIIKNFNALLFSGLDSGNATMLDPQMQKLLKEESFDLVIVGFFLNHYLIGLGDHFKCPTILLSTAGAITMGNLILGNPLDISAIPHPFTGYKNGMDFIQRLKNTLMYTVESFMVRYIEYQQEVFYK